jgi:hypothetical protein
VVADGVGDLSCINVMGAAIGRGDLLEISPLTVGEQISQRYLVSPTFGASGDFAPKPV